MIRRSENARPGRPIAHPLSPSPDEIRQLTAQIRDNWSPKKRARRAGHAARVEVLVLSALDLARMLPDERY